MLSKESKNLQPEIDRLNAELDTANRRAALLESDLARLRSVQAETLQQLNELSTGIVSGSPTTSIIGMDSEDGVPSSSVSSSGDSDSSTDSAQKDLTPKNLMMALLMLLSPVFSHDSQKASGSSTLGLTPAQSSFGLYPSNLIQSTSFDQFLKTDALGQYDPSSFYGNGDFDMSTDLSFSMPSSVFVGGSTSFETGYGEMDLLKSSVEVVQPTHTHLSGSPTHSPISVSAADSASIKQAVELDVEVIRDSQDSNKVRVRIGAPYSNSNQPAIAAQLPQDFLSLPSSPITGLEGVTYSYSSPSQGSSTERKRVRIALDSTQGWNVHVEDC